MRSFSSPAADFDAARNLILQTVGQRVAEPWMGQRDQRIGALVHRFAFEVCPAIFGDDDVAIVTRRRYRAFENRHDA